MIAALSAWHEQHERAAAAIEEVEVLPAHVLVEAYSVLTRLPSGLAVAPPIAAEVLTGRFRQPPLRLSSEDRASVLDRLAAAGVLGGATYDGLVALEAIAHARTLLTLDERAQSTYRRLGAEFTVIAR
ncbi:MAG: PIN domain-containing protein [Solirubrobacteraceae bacterium]